MTDLILRTILFLLVIFLAVVLGVWSGAATVQHQAVQNGHAHYDTITGAFTWGKP